MAWAVQSLFSFSFVKVFYMKGKYRPLCILSPLRTCLVHYVFWRHDKHTRRRFAVDFEAILCETAREVYTILDRAAPIWSPNRGRRFRTKEPERRGKAVVLISLPNQVSPYEKKFIQTNEPFFTTWLISSIQSNLLIFHSAKKSIFLKSSRYIFRSS